jgi:hypothetical protein
LGYGAVQVGFATASVAVSLQLARAREAAELGDREELQQLGWDPDTYGSAFQQRRYLVQWPVTFAFYLTWGFSAIDAARWHQGHPPPLQVGTTPAGTPVLSVHSRL